MGEYTNNTCHRKTIHTVSRKKTNSVSVQVRALFFFILFSCFFKALGGWVKIKLKLSSHIIHMSCFGLTRAPVSTAGHVAATGLVSMSTPPDPEGSGTVEIVQQQYCCGGQRGSRKIRWVGACCHGSLGAVKRRGFTVGLGWTFHSASGFSLLDRNACPSG